MASEKTSNIATPAEKQPPADLRIACLEPSATAICLELGLQDYIVGVTHECHELIDDEYTPSVSPLMDSNRLRLKKRLSSDRSEPLLYTLTQNGLTPEQMESQGAIHDAVQATSVAAQKVVQECARASDSEPSLIDIHDIPTLYPLLQEEFIKADPTVVFTQDLCNVCAPTTTDVYRILKKKNRGDNNDDEEQVVQVHSLIPKSLDDVAETFVIVAKACGVEERGIRMKEEFMRQLDQIKSTVDKYRQKDEADQANTANDTKLPRMLILEWLDPPFDGGHWTYQMMDFARVELARRDKNGKPKSEQLKWNQVYDTDPDLVVVGCCGFDLHRNIRDIWLSRKKLLPMRACQEHNVYACNGNVYIAQPGPALVAGTAILAACAYYHKYPQIVTDLAELNLLPPKTGNWEPIDLLHQNADPTPSTPVTDIEDLVGFALMHKEACDKGKMTYKDPATGYTVFSELAHLQRGKCCGSGCRHCPYSHENVKDDAKSKKIQQPAWMVHPKYNPVDNAASSTLHPAAHSQIKILFFSGGKDSFLTIRALVKQYQEATTPEQKFGLILLTTFDAVDRIIAHQEVLIDEVKKQAEHLKLCLLGIPLRRASGETYQERIARGLSVIRKRYADRPLTLAFGDLHLTHIKAWRDSALEDFKCNLEYPLWKVPYETLWDDLDASCVPCVLSASTVDVASAGTRFTRGFYKEMLDKGIDGFGEQGEFHSLAKVWEVSREQALGINT